MKTEIDEVKLRILGKIQSDPTPSNLRQISEDEHIPYSRLYTWKKELETAEIKGELDTLVNVDKLLVHRIAEETKQELEELVPSEGELLDDKINEVVESIDGYQVLNTKLQMSALKLANKIDDMSTLAITSKDLCLLVDALSNLQTAFFSKGTNVNILQNTNNYSTDKVSKFKELQKA